MAKEELENLTIEQLKKRKTLGAIVLVMLIVATTLSVWIVIYDLIIGDGLNTSLLVPAIACFVVAIPIYLGQKRVAMVLKNKVRH